MRLETALQEILERLNAVNVEAIFPEQITEDTCYTEMGQQLVLQDIKTMRLTLGRELLSFFEVMGLIDIRDYQKLTKNGLTEKLMTDMGKDPYSKRGTEPVKEFESLIRNAAKYDQDTYVMIIKILTVFSWKNEILADRSLGLKNKLAEVCSNVYLNLKYQMPISPKAIADRKEPSRQDAVMFGAPPTQPKKSTVDVSEYGEAGAQALMVGVYTSFSTYQLALGREDHVQAFRSFRRTVRMRKRFGINRALQEYFINQDQIMTQKSIEQMGRPGFDDLELRRFEVLSRTEQQIRNLKYKTILTD